MVCELDSWQLQGFGDAKLSPSISVFTTFMPDHMNYYKDSMEKYFSDKANIFKYQKKNGVLVVLPALKKLLPKDIKSKIIVANRKELAGWKFIVPGDYQRDNLSCAVNVARVVGVPEVKIKKAISDFKGLEGRMQLLRIYKGIKIYNDNNATTPEATIAGLEALSMQGHTLHARPCLAQGNTILICGGATKNLSLDNFVKAVNKYTKAVVMIPGTGTNQLIEKNLKVKNEIGKDLRDIVKKALKEAKKGDTILFSPAFASFGMFNNEYERNDLFMKIIKGLK